MMVSIKYQYSRTTYKDKMGNCEEIPSFVNRHSFKRFYQNKGKYHFLQLSRCVDKGESYSLLTYKQRIERGLLKLIKMEKGYTVFPGVIGLIIKWHRIESSKISVRS